MAKIVWKQSEIVTRVDNALQAAMMKAVLLVEADAKKLVNVDTGRLRASITHEVREIAKGVIQGKVGTNVSYGIFQELGSSRTPASPYLRPALEKNWPEIVRMIRGAL